jgi:hypothetical protein
MNRVGKLALVAGILAIALAVPIATAHLIFLYQAQVTVKPVTLPVVFLAGPEASEVSLSLTNKSNPQVSLTIPVTNSSGTYVYQALEVKALVGSPYLYVDSCSYTPGPTLSSVEVIVYPTSGSASSPSGTITITPSATGCTISGPAVQLTAGNTYYIDFLVQPSLPISYGTGSGTLTIYFGLSNQSGAVTIAPP